MVKLIPWEQPDAVAVHSVLQSCFVTNFGLLELQTKTLTISTDTQLLIKLIVVHLSQQ